MSEIILAAWLLVISPSWDRTQTTYLPFATKEACVGAMSILRWQSQISHMVCLPTGVKQP